MQDKTAKPETTTFWAGYSDGEIATGLVDTGFGGSGCTFATLPMLFKSKKAARLQFEDVRQVQIVEVANGKR